MKTNKLLTVLTLGILLSLSSKANAGPNDFFGGAVPGAAQDAADKAAAGGGDYTDDEKHMQKKYRFNIQHAKDLIKKGDLMVHAGTKQHNDKLLKKGKILKEIGEKNLATLEENNPFGHKDLQDKDKDKDKPDSARASAGSY